MRRSKLQLHISILEVLAYEGPLRFTRLRGLANYHENEFKEYLGFLINQGLVTEKRVGKRSAVYSITERGLTIVKQFTQIEKRLSIIE
jgi:predicted transcriptional regulator